MRNKGKKEGKSGNPETHLPLDECDEVVVAKEDTGIIASDDGQQLFKSAVRQLRRR